MSARDRFERRSLPQCGKSITKKNADGTTYYTTCIKLLDHKGKCF